MTLNELAAKYRPVLEELAQDLEAQSAAASESRRPVTLDQQSVGRLSRQDALQQQAMAKAQDERRRQDLNRIRAALERIEEGSFGLCLQCEEPILEKRLEIDPATSLCLDCRAG